LVGFDIEFGKLVLNGEENLKEKLQKTFVQG
jgi:hypothetical protein